MKENKPPRNNKRNTVERVVRGAITPWLLGLAWKQKELEGKRLLQNVRNDIWHLRSEKRNSILIIGHYLFSNYFNFLSENSMQTDFLNWWVFCSSLDVGYSAVLGTAISVLQHLHHENWPISSAFNARQNRLNQKLQRSYLQI